MGVSPGLHLRTLKAMVSKEECRNEAYDFDGVGAPWLCLLWSGFTTSSTFESANGPELEMLVSL